MLSAPALPDPRAVDVVALTRALCDLPSVSGQERALADAVEALLRTAEHLRVDRDGDTVLARTERGRDRRGIIAGHLDTVPVTGNLPTWRRTEDGTEMLYGPGTVDQKGGVAMALPPAITLTGP